MSQQKDATQSAEMDRARAAVLTLAALIDMLGPEGFALSETERELLVHLKIAHVAAVRWQFELEQSPRRGH